jgi:protein tyrosine phosphatase (PTP) superfamily phosphohydrolase (DUF442 family)
MSQSLKSLAVPVITMAMLLSIGCSEEPLPQAAIAPPKLPSRAEGTTPGLENVWHLSEKLYSGSSPNGEQGFRSLAVLGIKTIISVDGSSPNVTVAQRLGMRYIHLPVTYGGISRDRIIQVAKAIQDSPGPIYLHCHHGKHRGPAAAVAATMCLDSSVPPQTAIDWMKQMGTDPHYQALFSIPTTLLRPTSDELRQVKVSLSSVAEVTPLAESMIRIEKHFDRLASVKESGWHQPVGHPDVVPEHEALLLFEEIYELGRASKDQPAEFQQTVRDARSAAMELETLLRKDATSDVLQQRNRHFETIEQSCKNCHELYRDNLN